MSLSTATTRPDASPDAGPVNREWIGSILWGAVPQLSMRAEIGHLPSTTQDGRQSVLFDGWLHNRAELEAKLTVAPGQCSDADLLLRTYRRSGVALLDEIRGFFSLIVCDGDRGEIIAARDPLGSFPLFWASVGRELHFSQSIDVLLRHRDVPRTLNRAALADQLCRRWPDPEETFFESIRRIPPGRMMIATASARRVRRYWTSFPAGEEPRWIREDELGRFDELFCRAIERCVVPGRSSIYLSGGLDSISIATVAAAIGKNNGWPPLTALSLSYPDAEANEVRTQQAVARELGMPQVFLGIEETTRANGGILLSACHLSSRMPSPLIGIMAPSFRALDAEAKKRGCDYVISGVGGDELLTVAPVLAADLIARGDVAGLYRLAHSTRRSYSMTWPKIAKQLFWSRGLRPLLGQAVRRTFPGYMSRRHDRWIESNIRDWVAPDPELRRELVTRGRLTDEGPIEEPFYVHDFTRGIDLATLANEMDEFAADGRVHDVKILSPFFDKDLFDFLIRVPPDLLSRGGMSKALVREVLSRRYPELHFERQKKVFAFKYLRRQLIEEGPIAWRAMKGPTLLSELGLIDRALVDDMMEKIFAEATIPDADRAWEILNLEAWVRGREGRPVVEKG